MGNRPIPVAEDSGQCQFKFKAQFIAHFISHEIWILPGNTRIAACEVESNEVFKIQNITRKDPLAQIPTYTQSVRC